MSDWEDFELECTDYLNKTFGEYALFTHCGNSDSTVPDIFVETNNGDSFYIEAKMPQAQCGQFVLLPNIETRTFEYSDLNKHQNNQYSYMIISHMNQCFDKFLDAGTDGEEICMDSSIFSNWIIKTYKEKGVRYFITGEYTLFPIERFSEFFYVSAKYRIKRSGSQDVGVKNIQSVINYIYSHEYNIKDTRIYNKKLFVTSSLELHNKRFFLNGFEYMFSLRGSEYEIRKLSNTRNANVIFSVSQISTSGLANQEFISVLK